MFANQPFLAGACISLSVAVPVGPVALICIQRTLRDGLYIGLASGMGAATVHLFYGTLALLGFDAIGDFLRLNHALAQVVGGIVAIFLAARMLAKARATAPLARAGSRGNLFATYAKTCLVAISNPMTILGLAANLSTFELIGGAPRWQIVVGMFCGSALWWFIVCAGTATLRRQFAPRTFLRINHSTCALMMVVGAISIARTL